MEKKIRIVFYPLDASRVKSFALSRRLGVLIAAIFLPLSALGFWLAIAGPLHESSETKRLRQQLTRENRTLKNKVAGLDKGVRELRRDMRRLEEQKTDAVLLTGIEAPGREKRNKSSRLFSFFRAGSSSARTADFPGALDRARALSASLEASLETLGRNPSWINGLPTGYPVSGEAIVMREFGYGPDPFTGGNSMHWGVDFSLRAGAAVRASGAGTVVSAQTDRLWGNCVKIDHGGDIVTFYAHLQEISVRSGQKVARGQAIGLMGMSGTATGAHLHYELNIRGEKYDPMQYFLPKLVLAGEGEPRS